MAIVYQITTPGKLITIEDSSVTTSPESRTVTGVNDYIINDGPNNITFTVTDPDTNTQAFTLKPGEINDTPFRFKSIQWAATSGTSAFRMVALQFKNVTGG